LGAANILPHKLASLLPLILREKLTCALDNDSKKKIFYHNSCI
jgi:hypothetical protein